MWGGAGGAGERGPQSLTSPSPHAGFRAFCRVGEDVTGWDELPRGLTALTSLRSLTLGTAKTFFLQDGGLVGGVGASTSAGGAREWAGAGCGGGGVRRRTPHRPWPAAAAAAEEEEEVFVPLAELAPSLESLSMPLHYMSIVPRAISELTRLTLLSLRGVCWGGGGGGGG